MKHHLANCGCSGPSRRGFLADMGMGFVGLALGAMLHRDGIVARRSDSRLEPARVASPISRLGPSGSSG